MNVILDTNVFVSGVFFSGPPFRILQAWRDRRVHLVVSPGILDEYQRVADILKERFPNLDLDPIIDFLVVEATVVSAPDLSERISADPDDDKFLACAIASSTQLIISGDRHLLDVNGYRGIRILRPRQFLDELRSTSQQ